nr:PREDICTED: uncharacterized protein LOC100882154 isoform X2 [Megachile rotundata]
MLKFWLFLLLINRLSTEHHAYKQKTYELNVAFKRTSDLFNKLKLEYGFENLNKNVMDEINETVVGYVRNTSNTFFRHKRELLKNFNKGIDTLKEFQDFIPLNFHNARDVNIFSLRNGLELTWFAAVLDASKVSLFKINKAGLNYVTAYSVTNGTQLVVNDCNDGILLIVQNQYNFINILRFAKVTDKYLQPIQEFEWNDRTHLTIWKGMNKLYLGIASDSNISIYSWFGDYFDLIQIINLGTKKLVPFQSKGFMYLAATGSTTTVFKYFLKSNKFLAMQQLSSSQDISFFQVKEGHFTENFLSLSTWSSVIIYKSTHGRFVPFQQISSGTFTAQIISNKAILFFALHKDTVSTYQYNGWRFIKLAVKLNGIHRFHKANLYGKQLLLVKYNNDTWALKQPIWTKKKTYKDIQEEIRAWNIKAKDTAQRKLNEIFNLDKPVRILKGHIDQLFVHNINQHNSQALQIASEQYNKMKNKLLEQNIVINNKWKSGNLTVSSLRANKFQMKCKTKCKINKVNINGKIDLLSKLQALQDRNKATSFKTLAVKEIKNWKCPIFNLPIDNIDVDKSINGVLLENLQKNTLKVSGSQKVFGRHTFVSINVTNTLMPLNIALNLPKQEIRVGKINVTELTVTEGGVLLPLNGLPTVITGLVKASNITVKNKIDLQGSAKSNWMKKLSPIRYIPESITLDYDLKLENVKIENLQSAGLIVSKVGSVKEILSNAISLRDNVPISLVFSSEKVKWHNVAVHGFQNWITANSENIITGKKYFLQNVEITESSYESIRFPWIETALCGATVIVPEIKVPVLTLNNITVKSLTSLHVFGNMCVKCATNNSSLAFKPFDSSAQPYYHNVKAKNIITTNVNNINLITLEKLANSWIEPNILKTPVEATELKIKVLQSPMQFYAELSKVIRNVVSKQNTYTDSINKINLTDFLANAIKVGDIISLMNIKFNNGFTANRIYTPYPLLPMVQTGSHLRCYKNRISGITEVNTINLPYYSRLVQSNTSVNIIVKGSAIFSVEPMIHSINKNKLNELFTQTWIISNPTTFYGKNLHLTNALITGNITLKKPANTLCIEMWKNISEHVLSKRGIQKISVDAFLNNVETNTIVGSNTSRIISSVSDFNDIFDDPVMKDRVQDVKAKWTFNKLKILGQMDVRNKINNMNLKTDVMRHDSKNNIVTGKKTVMILTTKNLNGLNFAKWIDNTLTQKEKHITIKGQKSFLTAMFNNITLSGTVLGHTIDEALLKSANQTVYGQKKIHGSIYASTIFIDGLVNDINLNTLIDNQLKKQSSSQNVETEIELQENLFIMGNLIVNDTYAGANMKNFEQNYANMPFITEKMDKYLTAAETINLVLKNRAVYINKLGIVKNINNISRKSMFIENEQCKMKNFTKYCVNEYIEDIIVRSNTSNVIFIKSVLLNEDEFVVWVEFDLVSIFLFDAVNKSLVYVKGLHVPKIIEALVESMLNSLWIVIRLISQTLVLHYQPWKDLQKYVLPATDVFALSRTPNNQLLLFLSNGIWDLNRLASPRNIIEIPLKGQVETIVDGFNYFIKYTSINETTLTKARYVEN